MFKQGKNPALTVAEKGVGDLIAILMAAGYDLHEGSFKRHAEVTTLSRKFRGRGEKRQIHVQIVMDDDGMAKVYAHTEPDVALPILHTISAVLDMASYQAGARMLKRDLASNGWSKEDSKKRRRRA